MVGQVGSTKRRLAARRPKRRRNRMNRYFRLTLVALITCVAAACVIMALHKLVKPYLLSYGEARDITRINGYIADAEKTNKELRASIDYLSTPQGKIAEARRLGWVKRGEIAVVVEQPSSSQTKPAAKDSASQSAARSAGSRVLRFFVRPNDKD